MNQKARQFALGLGRLKERGYDPWGPFVQAWLETAQFNRIIGNHNYWGMKCPRKWAGITITVITHEDKKVEYEENGEKKFRFEKVQINDNFVDFPNLDQSLDFYDMQVQRLYKDAYSFRGNHMAFWEHLVDSDEPGEFCWATDRFYTQKLSRLYLVLSCDPAVREFIP